MLNRIIVMGRLTHEPELRETAAKTPVCSFSIACDRDFKPKDGEKETDFLDCVAWRSTAEFVSQYFTKGRMAIVDGRLQIREWTDREGGKRRSAEIIADHVYFGDSKPNKESGEKEPPSYTPKLGPDEGLSGGIDLPEGFVPDLDGDGGDGGDLPF